MKRLLIITYLGGILFLTGCVKNQTNTPPSILTNQISTAQNYFKDSIQSTASSPGSYPGGIPKIVHWEDAREITLPAGKGVIVPLKYSQPLFVKPSFAGENIFHLDDFSQLFIYQVSIRQWHVEVLSWFPDSNYVRNPAGTFSGQLSVDDWWGNSLSKYWYTDGQVRKYQKSSILASTIIRTCTVIYGYNYAVGDPGGGYSYVQTGGCYDMYIPDRGDYGDSPGGNGTGGGGGGGAGAPRNSTLLPGDKPIANIEDYLKCFTNVGGNDHSYKVTICVEQPVSGSRTPWRVMAGGPIGSSSAGNVVYVGHTFLIFTEQYGTNTITRNLGFYPSTGVTPSHPASPGQLNNNEDHNYTISASFSVTNADFFIMLNSAMRGNDPSFSYNLNSENCTSFALQTLADGGISLPSTIGTWPGGMGCNPGDLGEDIRNMTLLPNMTKNLTQTYHSNVGNCQ